jgi:hypothetical protein
MPGFRSEPQSDPNWTALHPRSGPVQGPVQKNPKFGAGSGLGFTLGQTCVDWVRTGLHPEPVGFKLGQYSNTVYLILTV